MAPDGHPLKLLPSGPDLVREPSPHYADDAGRSICHTKGVLQWGHGRITRGTTNARDAAQRLGAVLQVF
jgi:hypothetical protein